MPSDRYMPTEIIEDPNASIKHFQNENSGDRDRFGNRLIVSKNLAYLDRAKEKVKAGILVSKDGQKFITENNRILQDVETGLASLEKNGKIKPNEIIDLGNGRSLQYIKSGGQSNFYILKIGQNKYAIKTHILGNGVKRTKYQPYINEMLQTQSLATDLKDKLNSPKINVRMARFLFASGQVSCTYYEEEKEHYSALNAERFIGLMSVVSEYVRLKQKQQDPLWENVHIDLLSQDPEMILRNFRTQLDDSVVWVDPFVYLE